MAMYDRRDMGLVRTFEAVAAERSFGQAAKVLGMSKATVSDQVRALEEKVGRVLVDRSTPTLSLTAAGETMHIYAQALLGVSDQIGDHFARLSDGEQLRLGLAQDAASTRLAELLRLFHIDHPDCRLLICTTDSATLLAKLKNQELDIVLGKQRADAGNGRVLVRTPSVWIGSRDLVRTREHPVPLIVSLATNGVSRLIAIEALTRAGLDWRIVMEGDSLICLRSGLEAGLGLSVGARVYLPSFAQPIESHKILPRLADQEYVLSLGAARPSSTTTFFAAFIEEVFTRLVQPDRA